MTDFLVNDDDSALIWPKPTDTPSAPALGALTPEQEARLRDYTDALRLDGWKYAPADLETLLQAYDAQAKRLATLEPCYQDAQSTAARLLIEREQYDQTLRNAEERAQFAVERADAAEAERDQARAELDEHRLAYTALVGERDKYQALWYETARMVHEERQRATRLVALEAAARNLADWHMACRAAGGMDAEATQQGYDLMDVLFAAVANLAAPPGEGA